MREGIQVNARKEGLEPGAKRLIMLAINFEVEIRVWMWLWISAEMENNREKELTF